MALFPDADSSLLVIGFVLILCLKFAHAYYERSKLKHIPTLGADGVFTSYLTAFRWITKATDIIEEGYRLYPGGIYKIPTIDGWQVVVNGRDMVDDIRKATDRDLSNLDATDDILQVKYTMHPHLSDNPYHIDVVRTPLTRNIGICYGDMLDEVQTVISEKIPPSEDWVEIHAHDVVLQIVVRAVNRFFVGLPLCREPEWCELNIKFTMNVVINSLIINLFPKFMQPVVGRIFTARKSSLKTALKYLKPIIEERLMMQERYGKDWTDKPNDYIQWCMDAEQNAPLSQRTSIEDLTVRVLAVNFAAVHTTSAFTYALFNLAAHPEIVDPLRKEVEHVLEREGWSKVGMVQMKLLDSFLKESERMNGVGATGLPRKVLKDFTFSNGTTVPAGSSIVAAVWAIQRDDKLYPNGNEFNPYRFFDKRSQEGEAIKHQLVTPTLEWVLFGQGKHACPGRFFASAELKT
ncbi:hypothetical protein D9758_011089 [Tetrapyrgos nigripes]|uniref:Cytochrome P450 n=1 Tax=Tetrapyrgos nigripes TaxID=182062 RepID=A0A8H5FSK7_9AGAR|nr:hypothetical protein D9758_011089 [Tetrapyrgos nigripes]